MKKKKIHVDVWFEGRVQGVRFRYTTQAIAQGFTVTGQVRNLTDGRVWLEVEGEEGTVEFFLSALKKSMSYNINRIEEERSDKMKGYSGFTITYDREC